MTGRASISPLYGASQNVFQGKRVMRAAADIFDGTQKALFTVAGGQVVIECLHVTVSGAAIDGGASNTKFVMNPTTGTDADMCAVLDINADEEGTIYVCPMNGSTALRGGSGGSAQLNAGGWIAPAGTIDISTAADVGTGGALGAAHIYWYPMDDGATVTAA